MAPSSPSSSSSLTAPEPHELLMALDMQLQKQEFYQDLDLGLSLPQIADKSNKNLKERGVATA